MQMTWYIKYFPGESAIHVRGMLVDGKQEGLWEEYYENPYFMKAMNRFSNGLMEGTQMSWHPNGHLHTMIEYSQGHLHGEMRVFDTQRILVFHAQYEMGNCIKIDIDTLSSDQSPSPISQDAPPL